MVNNNEWPWIQGKFDSKGFLLEKSEKERKKKKEGWAKLIISRVEEYNKSIQGSSLLNNIFWGF